MTVDLDTDRLALLRLQRGIAIRQLALDSGIDIAVLNRLDARGLTSAPSLTLNQFLRLADTLGVDPRELLAEGRPVEQPRTPEQDVALLGALLHDLTGAVPTVVVAAALGWTLPHTHAVADNLDLRLHSAGLKIHRDSGRIALRSADDKHADATVAVRQNPRTSLSQRLLTPKRTRLVFQALRKPLSQHALSEDDRREIAVLIRAGILCLDEQRDIAATPDVRASLLL